MNEDLKKLRRFLDAEDPSFMMGHQGQPGGGHQIISTKKARPRTAVPEWVFDKYKMRGVLLAVFPKMNDWGWVRYPSGVMERKLFSKDVVRAGKWRVIAHEFYSLGKTEGEIANDYGITISNVRSTIRALRRAGDGKWTNGKGERGVRPRGRPKKQCAKAQATKHKGVNPRKLNVA